MKLKIPPVIVLMVFGTLMYLLSQFLPFGYFDFYGRHYLVTILAFSAVIVIGIAWFQFYKRKTTVNPKAPSKATGLITGGIYKYSRNPMYLGMLLLLLAWGLKLGNAFNTLLAAAFVSYMNAFQIVPEEAALLRIFGKEYQLFLKQVRRWF